MTEGSKEAFFCGTSRVIVSGNSEGQTPFAGLAGTALVFPRIRDNSCISRFVWLFEDSILPFYSVIYHMYDDFFGSVSRTE